MRIRHKKSRANPPLAGGTQTTPQDSFEASLPTDPDAGADAEIWATRHWLVPDRQENDDEWTQQIGPTFKEKTEARGNDPAWYYLRELGTVPLLGRDDEVRLAKTIEEGEAKIMAEVFSSLLPLRYVLELEKKIAAGTLHLNDVINTPEISTADPRLVEKTLRRRFRSQVTKLQSMAFRYEGATRQATKRLPETHRKRLDKKMNRLRKDISASLSGLH